MFRRFAHFFSNLLKSLGPSFAKSVVGSFQFIEYKGLIEMAEPRVVISQYARYRENQVFTIMHHVVLCWDGRRGRKPAPWLGSIF